MARTYNYKQHAVVLDFDDTLCSFLNALCIGHNRLHNTLIYPTDFHVYDIMQLKFKDVRGNEVLGEDVYKTFKLYEPYIYASLKPLSDVKNALHLIRVLGYKIIILTARDAEYEEATRWNLAHECLEYDELIFSPSSEKANVIRRLSKTYNVVAFADDKLETCEDVQETTRTNKVYIVNAAHNKGKDIDSDITRVNSVFEVVRDLKDVSGR